MSEALPILETLLADHADGRTVVLCAVVKTAGSTPQAPGSLLLLRDDRSIRGTVGGGLVEAETIRTAADLLGTDGPTLIDSRLDADPDQPGMICGGRMWVALRGITPRADVSAIQTALGCLRRGETTELLFDTQSDGEEQPHRVCLDPSPKLLIAGGGHVGRAVANLAVAVGFDVTVVDDRAEIECPEAFNPRVKSVVAEIAPWLAAYPLDPSCYVAIMTRGHQRDRVALEAVVGRGAAYVGMIGSKRKVRTVLEQLAVTGVSREALDQVYTPIGLEIGAITLPELSVSIVGELIAARRKFAPTSR